MYLLFTVWISCMINRRTKTDYSLYIKGQLGVTFTCALWKTDLLRENGRQSRVSILHCKKSQLVLWELRTWKWEVLLQKLDWICLKCMWQLTVHVCRCVEQCSLNIHNKLVYRMSYHIQSCHIIYSRHYWWLWLNILTKLHYISKCY